MVTFAYVQAKDVVTVEWVSSKESYEADEAIKLKLVVTNGSSEEKRFTYADSTEPTQPSVDAEEKPADSANIVTIIMWVVLAVARK